MAEGKKSFIAYSDWKDTFDSLPDEVAGKLIKHIFAYVNDDNPTTDDYIINGLFANIKNTLKRDLDKWEKQHQQRIEAGRKSAENRRRNQVAVNARSVSSTDSDSDSDSVSGSVNENIIKSKPSIEDIKAYTLEKGYEVDANKIWHYYNDKNWHDAKGNPVKNWKTKILNNWCKEENKIKPKPFSLQDYDIPTEDHFGYSKKKLIELCESGHYPKA